jgi:hypothetical protein
MGDQFEDLETYLGLRKGFFSNLQKEDDWSFVIKLFSLFEAATTSLIVENLSHPELEGPFAAMQMGTIKNGKLAFVHSLDLVRKSGIKYIETLGWLRNRFAHNISSTSHNIGPFIDSLTSERRKECRKYLNFVESVTSDGKEITGRDIFQDNPRLAIFVSGYVVLHEIRQRTITGQQMSKIKSQRLEHYSEINGSITIRSSEHKIEKIR